MTQTIPEDALLEFLRTAPDIPAFHAVLRISPDDLRLSGLDLEIHSDFQDAVACANTWAQRAAGRYFILSSSGRYFQVTSSVLDRDGKTGHTLFEMVPRGDSA